MGVLTSITIPSYGDTPKFVTGSSTQRLSFGGAKPTTAEKGNTKR